MPIANPSSCELAPAATEAWLARHARLVLTALLGAAVFVRLILCLQVGAGPLPRLHTFVPDSDNHFFDAWGRHIAGGDWLQRSPLHPTTVWMEQVADEAMVSDPPLPVKLGLALDTSYDRAAMRTKLWDRWLGGATFFQEPAYPYLVGLTYWLTGAGVWHVFAWQLAVGVLGVLLVHRLALRLFSHTAAAVAGALAVLAPIPLFYEVTLLRDGLVAVTTVALALVMCWATAGGLTRWLGLGLAFGAASLLKQSFLAFPVLMAVWRLASVRTPWRDRLVAAGLATVGIGLALLPAVLRNVVVGAPALAMNGSATAMLAVYHTSHATPFGLVVEPAFARVLLEADGHFLPSLVAAARTHATPWGVVVLALQKLLYTWHGFEAANNVDFYVFRQGAPLLAALPVTVVVLVPLAGVGLASRRAGAAWPALVAIAASLPTLILAAVHARYRAPVATALLPLAGAGVVRLSIWMAAGRWLRTSAAAGAAALYLAWATGSPPGKEPGGRAREYALLGIVALDRGEPALAVLHLRESLQLVPGDPRVEARLGQALLASGDAEGALVQLGLAARSLDSAGFRELHAHALAAAGRRVEAIAQARAALSADPARPGLRELLDRLDHGPAAITTPRRPEEKP